MTIIDVRNSRCYVARKRDTGSGTFTYDPAANWQQLEDLAADAVSAAGGGITLSDIYPCPESLAALALWAEDVLALVTTPQEAEAAHALGVDTVRKAAQRGVVRARRSGATWLIYAPDVEGLPAVKKKRND